MALASSSLPSSWHQKVSMLRIAVESQERSTTGARLLENVDKTGDIILLGKNGVEMAAHSAVLAESPYFWARFSQDWQSSQWNFNNKLKLRLPFDVTAEGLEILLEYLYIGNSCFARRGPLDSILVQELLSLAEACAIPDLCKSLVNLVKVDEDNVKVWLSWLEGERTADVRAILAQCSEVLQKKFQRLSQWALLSAEELSQLCKIGERLHSTSLEPCTNLKEGHVLVKLVTEWDVQQRIGKSGIFDLVNFDKIEGFSMDGETAFADFKSRVANELGIPLKLQRYWLWAKRRNETTRLNRPLSNLEESWILLELAGKPGPHRELWLFLEAPVLKNDLLEFPFVLHERTSNDILLFFKLFDVEKETLEYVGSMYVDCTSKLATYFQRITELAKVEAEHDCKLFEEIMFLPAIMVEEVHQSMTFKALQLEDGDIICIQKWAKHSDKGLRFNLMGFLELLKTKLLEEAF